MKTVGELRRLLETLDDDMIILKASHNEEKQGALVNNIRTSLYKYKKTTRTFRDSFDHREYSSEVYVPDEDGDRCLYLY